MIEFDQRELKRLYKTRKVERKLHECEEVRTSDYDTYPMVDTDVFSNMVNMFMADTSVISAFPFFRVNSSGRKYVELYVWDKMLYPACYRRFIITPGMRMDEESEQIFLRYVTGYMDFDPDRMESFNKAVIENMPEWHYKNYRFYQLGRAMQHLYYVSHPSGVREILYKADLDTIAYHIDRIPDYNMIGSDPESIMGHGFSMNLLRIFNKYEFVHKLYYREQYKIIVRTYREYSGYICNPDSISLGQWEYLELLESGEINDGFNRALYNALAEDDGANIGYYCEYLKLRQEIPYIKNRKIPKPEEIEEVIDTLRNYQEVCRDSVIDNMIRDRYSYEKNDYEYTSDKYSVIMPEKTFDIFKEAIDQGNCLMNYLEEHADKEDTILFIRKTDNMSKSFVTLEIKEGRIQEVEAKFNRKPDVEVFRFLEEYSREKNLIYNPNLLIKIHFPEDVDDPELHIHKSEQNLYNYLKDYELRMSWPRFSCVDDGWNFTQFELHDYFPDTYPELAEFDVSDSIEEGDDDFGFDENGWLRCS